MKDLKGRLKTVLELLTNAQFIRKHADVAAAGEANDWEKLLMERRDLLMEQLHLAKQNEKTELAHAHAE